MPIELILSPFMRPVVKAHAYLMGFHRESSHYTPQVVDLLSENATKFVVRKEFGTGSKIFAVFDGDNPQTYDEKIYHMTRSRAVKGAYKMYEKNDELPIAAIRAGLRSNVMLIKTADLSELELGWHVVDHVVDALDDYREFQLADGERYHWTFKGQFLERIRNPGQKEAEVRERVGSVKLHPNRKGFDLFVNESIVNREMAICTALICYIEAWNTWRGYGGIYLAEQHQATLPWKRD